MALREIIFRGKRKGCGAWVYGFLTMREFKTPAIFVPSEKEKLGYAEPFGTTYCVDPETVGQFTGLTDKNGKKIFEGDIVQYFGTYALEVYIENGHTKTRWFDTVTNSKCTELFFGYDEEAYGECEVIGNIHDNPELLEG